MWDEWFAIGIDNIAMKMFINEGLLLSLGSGHLLLTQRGGGVVFSDPQREI